jgi:hypothetical protein
MAVLLIGYQRGSISPPNIKIIRFLMESMLNWEIINGKAVNLTGKATTYECMKATLACVESNPKSTHLRISKIP